MRVLVITWGPGGNLPPMLAAASLLDRRGHEVVVLASGETRSAAEQLGLEVANYRRSPDPDVRVAFEEQSDRMMRRIAGSAIALDARVVLDELRPDLTVVDCMLPAAIAAARATGTPCVSLVHFLYGLARTQMLRAGGGWTTDLQSLAATHRLLGLSPARDGLSAWEAPELVLVTAPRSLDIDCDAPANVIYAGPLGVAAHPQRRKRAEVERQRVLLTFSTTVMGGQTELIDRVCEAVGNLDLEAVLTLGPAVDRDAVRVPENVEVVAFADHDRLMPEMAAVIGHGGLGTVLRALAHGVPQLLLPLGRDQAFNAGRIEQRDAGKRLPTDAPPGRIQTALQELLTDSRFEAAAAAVAGQIAADEPDRTAAEAIEHAAAVGVFARRIASRSKHARPTRPSRGALVTGRSSLEQGLAGDVVGPDDAGWTAARAAWNLAVDQHPALVVVAAGPEDVAATLGYAAEHGLRVAPQGTGHGASSLDALDETILLRTTRLGGVEIDSSARTARVGAGAVWDDVVGPAAKHGLAALHGFSGGVGVAGYTLGGGLGWLSRSRGLAANAVTGLDVVLADGRALRVEQQSEPELFWALRGGGGLGAVVTAFEVELFPLSEAYAGHIAWPLEHAPEVVDAYRSWTNDLPEELTSTIRLMRYPPAPELPPELRGQAFALVTLVFDGGADEGAQLVAPLRGVGSPSADTVETVAGDQLPQISGDPPGPLAGIGHGMLMRELDPEAYLAVGGPEVRTPLTNVEFRHLGGALARSAEGQGAAGAIDAQFLFYAVGTPAEPPSAADLTAALDEAQDQLAGSATGQSLATFAERQPGVDGLFSVETTARLAEVRRRYDPDGLIRSNHEL